MLDKYKILIVDDDKFLLNMYSSKFTKEGHDVISASSSQDALDKLADGLKPNIFVLDIIMPGIDGIGLLREITEKGYNKDSIVVMLTNQADTDQIEEAKSLGIDGYIVKATAIPSEVVEEVMKIANDKFN